MATEGIKISIIEAFAIIPDPRIDRGKKHQLSDMIVIAICTIIAGGEGWDDMEDFGNGREEWLRKFLDLENGIPSADTFRRVFERLDTVKFQECFTRWSLGLAKSLEGQVVALDGKTLRSAFNKGSSGTALHMVNAWATESGLALAQVEVESKSNEIKALPKILDMLALKGCIVTTDAMGCQKEVAKKIREKEGDYVFGLKDNHPTFRKEVETFFKKELNTDASVFGIDIFETTEKGHGRIETRKYFMTSDIDWTQRKEDWKDLASIAMVESTRKIGNDITTERRFYISSLSADAKKFAVASRSHWGIENSLHWVLDVTFGEDQCKVRRDLAAENLAMLRKIALNLLKTETTAKKSIKKKRKLSVWDDTYMFKILTAGSETSTNQGF